MARDGCRIGRLHWIHDGSVLHRAKLASALRQLGCCKSFAKAKVILNIVTHADDAQFTALQGVTLSPMFFLNPAILSRAGLYTLGSLGGLCYVGATAKNDQFLYIGGFLMAGLGVLIVAGLAPMIMPRMAMRTMTALEHVTAYGGQSPISGVTFSSWLIESFCI